LEKNRSLLWRQGGMGGRLEKLFPRFPGSKKRGGGFNEILGGGGKSVREKNGRDEVSV